MTALRIVAAALAAQLFAAPLWAQSRQVVVSGRGEAQAANDMAQVSLAARARADTAAEAYAATARAAAALMEAARAQGVEEADMRTVGLSLNPLYSREGDRRLTPEGYEAQHRLSVDVRAQDSVGPLIDAASGVADVVIENVAFMPSDIADATTRARSLAMQDARATAQALAAAESLSLGAVMAIEQGLSGRPGPVGLRASAMEAMPTAPGASTVTAEVTVTYALE
jgi:uncharacterized protein YggE